MTATKLQEVVTYTAHDLAHEIDAAIRADARQKIGPWKPSGITASNLGPCRRERVLYVTNWMDRPLPDEERMERMELGNDAEKRQIARLLRLGFEVVEGQQPFEIKARDGKTTILKGKIDGKIRKGRRRVPFEHKFWAPQIVDRLNTTEDFDRWEWTLKALRQMQAYLYANSEPDGLFILWDGRGFPKCVPVELDYETMEQILTECEEDTRHIAQGTQPDFCKDPTVCRKCWAFGRCCHPPMNFGEGIQVVDDEEIISMIEERARLEEAGKQFDMLDKKVKEYAKARGVEDILAGDFHINVKTQQRSKKVYAPDAKFTTEKTEAKIVKIERLTPEAAA